MGFPPFFSLKGLLIAISFALAVALLLLLSSCGCYSCSCSSTLLLLVLPTSFPFIVSKIKRLAIASFMEEPTSESKLVLNLSPEEETVEENNPANEENDELQTDEVVVNGECLSMDDDSCSVSGENLDKLSCALEKSDCSVSEDKLASSKTAGSDDSISDDENLIEIALEDEFQRDLKGGFLPEFLPEMLFRKQGLMELLSEINEEDNMIEIDIVMGSVKCSRFEIEIEA